jgi:BirA family biotin operon repressor/biotin-[acetyl-CoA-carboxylase] ligase
MPHHILKFLREREDHVSGKEIGGALGLSEAAVCKGIRILREKGFVIDGVPSLGYRLLSSPDLSAEGVLSLLSGDFWKKVVFYESVGSTNEIATEPGRHWDGAGGGAVIIADAQESGRGRLGRRWLSPPGLNIYMSIVFRPDIPSRDVTLLTLLAAVAAARGLRRRTGAVVSIKWPNDLVVAEKKLGGILTEARSDPERIAQAVIGIGINVNMECRDLPEGINTIATSLLDVTGTRHSRTILIAGILEEFDYWYHLLLKHGRAPLLKEWRRLSSTLGKKVGVVTAGEVVEGIAEDLND